MVNLNIQSNCMRGEFLRSNINTAIREIHDDICTVFGPYACDAHITKNGQPYYTRDGKEVMESMKFDNEICNYILKIIYQAVNNQAEEAGDGTTTVAVFYTNLYMLFREMIMSDENSNASISIIRPIWESVIEEIIERVRSYSDRMTDNDLRSMLFTCTQDSSLSGKVYDKLKEHIEDGAYIMVNPSDDVDELQVTTYETPIIKATKQFSVRPLFKSMRANGEITNSGTIENCVIYHCNGMLDISNVEILKRIMHHTLIANDGSENGKQLDMTVMFLCNGITNRTRETFRELNKYIVSSGISVSDYNNISVFSLDDYRVYSSEQIEDLSTIITDLPGLGGAVASITFESMIYQALCERDGDSEDEHFSSLKTFDADASLIQRLKDMYVQPFAVSVDNEKGIMLHKPLGPVSQKRYDSLMEAIRSEKSDIKRIQMTKRMRSIYGKYIDVKVGSILLKDSQRKMELVLDACVSSMEAAKYGVLRSNSILVAIKACCEILFEKKELINSDDGMKNIFRTMIAVSFMKTFNDMITNAGMEIHPFDPNMTLSDFYQNVILSSDITRLDLTRLANVLPSADDDKVVPEVITVPASGEYSEFTFTKTIVEPITVITTILKNSLTPIELAMTRTMHVNSFMQNYIDKA